MRETDTLVWHPSNAGVGAYNFVIAQSVPPGAKGPGTGRRLHVWAQEAGFERSKMQVGTGGTCYPGPDLSRWWAGTHIERLKGEVGKKWVEEMNIVDHEAKIDAMIDGLKRWGESPEAWYSALQGEVICWK